MEYKVFQSKIQEVDQKQGIVINYDNAFDSVDTDGDISRKGAFKKTLVENRDRAKWYLNHDQSLLLGVPFIEGTKEDDTGLLSYNRINTSKQLGADTLTDYMLFKEYNRTLEHSIGYNAVKHNPYDLGGGKKGRELTEVKIWEKSTLTSWGANRNTPVIDIKSEKQIKDVLEILEQMFTKNLKYSDERKRQAEKLIKELQSLDNQEPGETTLIVEPTIEYKQILETILKSLKNE
jgi:HK97 family phage prohead protease